MYVVSAALKQIFILDLVAETYTTQSTVHGRFENEPDTIRHIIRNGDATTSSNGFLYFTEDSGTMGIHGRDPKGNFFTLLETADGTDGVAQNGGETSGLAFSPDGMHMYFSLARAGVLYDITRADGLPFDAETLDIQYASS